MKAKRLVIWMACFVLVISAFIPMVSATSRYGTQEIEYSDVSSDDVVANATEDTVSYDVPVNTTEISDGLADEGSNMSIDDTFYEGSVAEISLTDLDYNTTGDSESTWYLTVATFTTGNFNESSISYTDNRTINTTTLDSDTTENYSYDTTFDEAGEYVFFVASSETSGDTYDEDDSYVYYNITVEEMPYTYSVDEAFDFEDVSVNITGIDGLTESEVGDMKVGIAEESGLMFGLLSDEKQFGVDLSDINRSEDVSMTFELSEMELETEGSWGMPSKSAYSVSDEDHESDFVLNPSESYDYVSTDLEDGELDVVISEDIDEFAVYDGLSFLSRMDMVVSWYGSFDYAENFDVGESEED